MAPLRLPRSDDWSDTLAGDETSRLRVELADAIARRRALTAEQSEATRLRHLAPQRDAAAYAAARRAGQPDPGDAIVRAAEERIAEVHRKAAGETATIESVERDLAAFRARRGEA